VIEEVAMNSTLTPIASALVLAALGAAPHRVSAPPPAHLCAGTQQKGQVRTAQPLAIRQSYSRAAAAHRTVRPPRKSSAVLKPPR
jgi:hypothetical protein